MSPGLHMFVTKQSCYEMWRVSVSCFVMFKIWVAAEPEQTHKTFKTVLKKKERTGNFRARANGAIRPTAGVSALPILTFLT